MAGRPARQRAPEAEPAPHPLTAVLACPRGHRQPGNYPSYPREKKEGRGVAGYSPPWPSSRKKKTQRGSSFLFYPSCHSVTYQIYHLLGKRYSANSLSRLIEIVAGEDVFNAVNREGVRV